MFRRIGNHYFRRRWHIKRRGYNAGQRICRKYSYYCGQPDKYLFRSGSVNVESDGASYSYTSSDSYTNSDFQSGSNCNATSYRYGDTRCPADTNSNSAPNTNTGGKPNSNTRIWRYKAKTAANIAIVAIAAVITAVAVIISRIVIVAGEAT